MTLINPLKFPGILSGTKTKSTHTTTETPSVIDPETASTPQESIELGEGPSQKSEISVTQETVAAPPALSPQLANASQNIARGILVNRGKQAFQKMNSQAFSDQGFGPVFQTIGETTNKSVGGSEPDFHYHFSQNLHHMGTAQGMASQRMSAGSDKPFGEVLAEEMKIQAEGLALLPYIDGEKYQELSGATEGFETTPSQSKDQQSVAKLKSLLPKESVDQAMASVKEQPLYVASQSASYLGESSSYAMTAVAETARGFLPLAVGARNIFFQAANGVGQHPAVEFAEMGNAMTKEQFSQDGGMAQVSHTFAKFGEDYIGEDKSSLQGFRAATDLSVLLLSMESGSQMSQMTGQDPNTSMKSALKDLVIQQGLMEIASLMLQQAAMGAVQNQAPTRQFQDGLRADLSSSQPTPVAAYNNHLLGMLSDDQAKAVSERVKHHPLNAIAEHSNMSELQDQFALPPNGHGRLRSNLADFNSNLMAAQHGYSQSAQYLPPQ